MTLRVGISTEKERASFTRFDTDLLHPLQHYEALIHELKHSCFFPASFQALDVRTDTCIIKARSHPYVETVINAPVALAKMRGETTQQGG